MSIRIPKYVLFITAYLAAVILYWPSLNGSPIWDDSHFWFNDPVMKLSYGDIWQRFSWPFSVSLQKVLLSIFDKNNLGYHCFNLLLHFANSYLVYRLGRVLRLKYAFIFFLMFLLHPAAVIATAWMIQVKTLVCCFFALLAVLSFLKGNKNLKWMIFSWVCFALSVLSKSASLTLPVILFVVSFRSYRFSKLHLLIPFFIISLFGSWKLFGSQIAMEGSAKAAAVVKIQDAPPVVVETPKAEMPKQVKKIKKPKKPKAMPVPPPVIKVPEVLPPPVHVPAPALPPAEEPVEKTKLDVVSQTMKYYFWHSLIPQNNIPVKGLNFDPAGALEIVHLLFLVLMIVLFWKDSGLIYLLAAHILLLPFLGIVPAPYMNITWVSDQHLYLVLPAILAFWLRILEKLEWKHSWIIPAFLLMFFLWKTREAASYYVDRFVFYEKCLEHDPSNVAMALNLANARIRAGQVNLAYNILHETIELSHVEKTMQMNEYFPTLSKLYFKVQMYLEENAR